MDGEISGRTQQPLRRLVVIAALAMCSGCGPSAIAPTSGLAPAPPSPAAPDAVLAITSFSAAVTPGFVGGIFALRETAGGVAVLESMLFEDSGGHSDFIDAWCWGDAGVEIEANSTFDSSALGYCVPSIRAASPGNSAFLTLIYRTASGRRVTLQSTAAIRN
jgi:hypothetical protein